MKKITKLLCLFIWGLFFIPLTNIKAANGLIDIYTSNKTPTVGSSITVTVYCSSSSPIGTCEYTLTYDQNKLSLTSGDLNVLDYTANNSTYKLSRKYTFKVISSGSSTISAKAYGIIGFDENSMATSVSGTTITGKSAVTTPPASSGSSNKVYSTNNNLKSLGVTGYKITPDFNKNVLSYSLSVEPNTESINITATLEDTTAKLSGIGKKEITEGTNKFDIVVTSEKGTTKTYILNVIVEDKDPIEVKIKNDTYTVLKKLKIDKPNSCLEKKVTINNIEIPAYSCEITGYTLVGLKDTLGNSNLYIYDDTNNSYSLYKELSFQSQIVVILDNNDIKKGYIKKSVVINDVSMEGYKLNSNSRYTLFYGINVQTGEKNWYVYEESEQTIQKFNEEQEKTINKQISNAKLIIYILGGIIVFLLLLLIIIASNNVKRNKKVIKKSLDKRNENTNNKVNSKDNMK